MKVLKPTPVTPANYYLYSNTAAGDYPEWNVATAYVAGDRVIVDSLKSQFECVLAHTGQAPSLTVTTYWVRVAASLTWRPFDNVLSDQQQTQGYYHTVSATELWGGSVVTGPSKLFFPLMGMGRVSTVAVLGTDARYVTVAAYNRWGNQTYFKTIAAVDTTPVIDAWTYCFSELNATRNFVFDGLDGWGDTTLDQIHITVLSSGLDWDARVGEIIVGNAFDLGDCHADAQIALVDYSRKEIDAYGTVSIVERTYSLTGSFDLEIEQGMRARVQNVIASLRATPAVYFPTADDANNGIVIYGTVKDYNTTYQTPKRAYATLEIMGLS
jgi:hypothetical protein